MPRSRHLWTRDLLAELGVPGTYYNALAVIAQIQAEGGQARFNPLNTTLKQPGSTDYNSVPVQNYTSWEQGLHATAATLRQPNMALLMRALKQGSSSAAYWQALAQSPWGTKPPGSMGVQAFLDDVRRHWYDRAMLTVAGS